MALPTHDSRIWILDAEDPRSVEFHNHTGETGAEVGVCDGLLFAQPTELDGETRTARFRLVAGVRELPCLSYPRHDHRWCPVCGARRGKSQRPSCKRCNTDEPAIRVICRLQVLTLGEAFLLTTRHVLNATCFPMKAFTSGRLRRVDDAEPRKVEHAVQTPIAVPEATVLRGAAISAPVRRERSREPTVVRTRSARLGQRSFRESLIEAHGAACQLTNCRILQVVEAAHLFPVAVAELNDPTNGLLLRSDLHTLFDMSLLAFEPETLAAHFHPALADDPVYGPLCGVPLRCGATRPSRFGVRFRWDAFLRTKDMEPND